MSVYILLVVLFVSQQSEESVSEHHQQYLTDVATVESIYNYVKDNDLAGAISVIHQKGDDQAVMTAWIGVQCDINNVKGDPYSSEEFARAGVDFALSKGFKRGAAILLHNITSFHMPNFDEGVDPGVLETNIAFATQQVELREQLDDKPSLAWSYWDKGTALMAAKRFQEAITEFKKSIEMAKTLSDRDLAAWSEIFIGKALVKIQPMNRAEGEKMMREAARVINEIGEGWEKEEITKILTTVGL